MEVLIEKLKKNRILKYILGLLLLLSLALIAFGFYRDNNNLLILGVPLLGISCGLLYRIYYYVEGSGYFGLEEDIKKEKQEDLARKADQLSRKKKKSR